MRIRPVTLMAGDRFFSEMKESPIATWGFPKDMHQVPIRSGESMQRLSRIPVTPGVNKMCYGTIYKCEIYCRNTNLNITSALNGSIQGSWEGRIIDDRCHVTACQMVDTLDSMGISTSAPQVTAIDPFLCAVIIVAVASVLFGVYYYLHTHKEEKP